MYRGSCYNNLNLATELLFGEKSNGRINGVTGFFKAGNCFETEKELIDDGLLESFDVITLIAELEDQFEVEIPAEEIVPENFNSAEGIWNLLQRIKGED